LYEYPFLIDKILAKSARRWHAAIVELFIFRPVIAWRTWQMIRFLNPIVIFIIIVFLIAKCVCAQEISEAEYQQLKNRLKTEFMQKLKEEIKEELIDELKSEYTIIPKQKQSDKKPNPTKETNTNERYPGKDYSVSSPSQSRGKVSVTKSERTSSDLEQVSPDSRKEKAKGIYTREADSIKPDEQKEDIDELELDKARYRLGEGISFGEQLLIIRGFGNVDAHYIDKNVGKKFNIANNYFSLGEFDLFMTAKLSNRISFLNETVFEFTQTEATETDIERLLIHYDVNSLLKIDVGKFFLPIGYWVPTYNHGAWFWTTIDRPEIVNFQDKGGPLPTHDTGIKLSGSALLESLDLNYAFAVSNGRGINTTQRQMFGDINAKKALSLQLEVKPHIIEGLRLGPSVYYDVIPEDKPNRNEMREIIGGGHIVYTGHNIELLTEAFEINHDESSGSTFNTFGGYAQCAYIINQFKPYYRYDYINYNNDDPFYNKSSSAKFDFLDTKEHTVGLRYDLSHFNALKFEYSHGTFGGKDVNIIGLQTAFSF